MRIDVGGLPEEEQSRVDAFNAAVDAGEPETEDRADLLADCRTAATAAIATQITAVSAAESTVRSGLNEIGQGIDSDPRFHDDPAGSRKRFDDRVSAARPVREARDELARRQNVAGRVAAVQDGMTIP